MDALADSNRLLREEKEGMQNTITEFKAKYESLEKQIEPLQEKQRLSDNKIESLMVSKEIIVRYYYYNCNCYIVVYIIIIIVIVDVVIVFVIFIFFFFICLLYTEYLNS